MKKSAFLVLAVVISGIGFVRAEDPATPPAAAPAAAAVASVKVEKMAVGTAIENKEISGEAAEFPGSTGRVYCWTKVMADATPSTIKHVWSVDGKTEAEVTLDIKYPSTRTWSSKSVWPGAWKVEAVDAGGVVMASKAFTVSKEPAQVGQ